MRATDGPIVKTICLHKLQFRNVPKCYGVTDRPATRRDSKAVK